MGSISSEVLSPKDKNRLLFEALPGSLPETNVPENFVPDAVASAGIVWLERLEQSNLACNVVWRDLCALTGTFRTFYGRKRVWSAWKELCPTHQPSAFKPVPGTCEIVRIGDKSSWVLMEYTFECRGYTETKCSGFIGLVLDSDLQWKIWMLTTLLEEIKGFPGPDKTAVNLISNAKPLQPGPPGAFSDEPFQCVVIGAGYSGLVIAGRLQAMGLKVVVLEKNTQLGDNWKNRYESARFHTTKEYSEFPLGRMFTAEDPTFPGRLDLIRFYERFVKTHGINVWCSSCLTNASYQAKDNMWTLKVDRSGETMKLRTQHLVLAIGGLGATPSMPNLRNKELFKGEVMHSFDYKSAHAWKGKAGVIIGSANTAHDVAEDMVDAEMSSVILIQRNPTPVFPIEWYKDLMDKHYNATSDLEYADRRTISLPVAIVRQSGMAYFQGRMEQDPEKLNALERAGFAIERSGDMIKCAYGDGAGGHHTDVGGGAKIIAGKINVKSNATPIGFTATGIQLADGSHIDADVIVFCTGFHTNMLHSATKLLGPKIASQLENFWGIDGEGELRGAFKKMNHPGIWFIGGGVPWARFGSRFLALQIQADIIGRPLLRYTAS